MISSRSGGRREEIIGNAVLWLKLAVEVIGAPVVGVGMSLAGAVLTRAGT